MMEKNNLQPEQSQPLKQNKNLKYVIIAAIVLIVAVLGYFILNNKKNETAVKKNTKTDSLAGKKDTLSAKIKTDSIFTKDKNNGEYYEEEPYGVLVYIGKGQLVGDKKLKYGDIVYVDYTKSTEDNKIIYLTSPYLNSQPATYSISANSLIDEGTFDNYKKYFSLAPFANLPNTLKDFILENSYSNGNEYRITQNAERTKSIICFGDFDGDGIKDVAVLLDNNEKQISRLLVICNNTETKKPYIGFAENYSDKMRINSFKKGSSIIIESELQSVELDGIILKAEDVKMAVVYDKSLQKFKTYYQE